MSLTKGCGFPQITLNGTKNDWIKLKQKASVLLKNKVMPKFGEKWANVCRIFVPLCHDLKI